MLTTIMGVLTATPARSAFVLFMALVGVLAIGGFTVTVAFAWLLDRQRMRREARAARASAHLRNVLAGISKAKERGARARNN